LNIPRRGANGRTRNIPAGLQGLTNDEVGYGYDYGARFYDQLPFSFYGRVSALAPAIFNGERSPWEDTFGKNQKPETRNQQPETSNQEPATRNQEPATT